MSTVDNGYLVSVKTGEGSGTPPTVPEPTFEELRTTALASLAARRWQVETGGIDYLGHRIATDRESQAMITGAGAKAQRDPDFTTSWKGADGSFTPVDADTIIAIGDAVSDHVAACFAREAELDAQIKAAADAEALAAIDIEEGWPA